MSDQFATAPSEALLSQLLAAKTSLASEEIRLSTELSSLRVKLSQQQSAVQREVSRNSELIEEISRFSAEIAALQLAPQGAAPRAVSELQKKLEISRQLLKEGDVIDRESEGKKRESSLIAKLAGTKQMMQEEFLLVEKAREEKARLVQSTKETELMTEQVKKVFGAIVIESEPSALVAAKTPSLPELRKMYKTCIAGKESARELLVLNDNVIEEKEAAHQKAIDGLASLIDPSRAKVLLAKLQG